MFAFSSHARQLPARPSIPADLRQRVRPLVSASSRTLPVLPALADVLPGASLRRGTTTLVSGPLGSGTTSLGIALVAHASQAGHWCAAIGFEDPGVAAMSELGLDLRKVVFVPSPRGGWAEAVAELLDGVELILLQPPQRVPHAAARQLVARARERRAALIVVVPSREQWPLPVEVHLEILQSTWQGAGHGEGRFRSRRADIRIEGRGATTTLQTSLWLPSARGDVVVTSEVC